MKTTEPEPRLDVLRGLARRVLGPVADDVTWELIPPGAGAPTERRYQFEARDGRAVIRGSDTVGAAVGLHEYLKAAAGRRVCWDTPLPLQLASLPDAEATAATVRASDVYYLNFCTFSYTTAYWDWERWQREIDWMALHGVTMPLAAVGHEAVLARVYRGLGLGDEEIREFLGGPGYLPFQFMGCLDSWAGPLPASWLEDRQELGARIVGRQLEYGMTPVLPAFSGHVPASLAGDGTTERSWWGFTTHLLAPRDPRFAAIAQRVVETQRELFGSAHLYAADPFIEMTPPSDDPDFLGDVATALVSALRAGDPDAVWVMQAWTFDYLDYWNDDRIAAFLDAVPDDAMLVLDLWGEHSPQWRRFDGFRGKRWLWCALHDFGGRCDAFGNVWTTRQECEAAQHAGEPPAGVGLAMEATDQNHVVYEMALDLAGRPIDDVAAWVSEYAAQRYGVADPRAEAAWTRLLATVYDAPDEALTPGASKGCVTLRPTFAGVLDERSLMTTVADACWYDPVDLVDASRQLLGAAVAHPELLAAELGHDLVTIAATALSRACDRLLVDVVAAWHRSRADLASTVDRFLDALHDLDTVLSLRPELRLATWEAAAAARGRSDGDRLVLHDNARRIISVWNTAEQPSLTDYAARLWSGLVDGLYRQRWQAWADELVAAAEEQRAPDEAVLADRIDAVSRAFVAGTDARSTTSVSDPLTELQRLLDTAAETVHPLPGAAAPNPMERS